MLQLNTEQLELKVNMSWLKVEMDLSRDKTQHDLSRLKVEIGHLGKKGSVCWPKLKDETNCPMMGLLEGEFIGEKQHKWAQVQST